MRVREREGELKREIGRRENLEEEEERDRDRLGRVSCQFYVFVDYLLSVFVRKPSRSRQLRIWESRIQVLNIH